MLKGLIGQEALLKQELAAARRNSERADKLNVEYLKNIVLSFLIKVNPEPNPKTLTLTLTLKP